MPSLKLQITKDKLSYIESQPWPFPRSLMVAYRAEVPTGDSGDGSMPELCAAARSAIVDSSISQAELQRCACFMCCMC